MTENHLLLKAEALSGVGGFEIDACPRALRWTPQVFRLHGLDASQPQPDLEQALELIDRNDRPRWLACVNAALQVGRNFEWDGTLAAPAGAPLAAPRRVRAVGQCELEDGRCVRVFGTLQAIGMVATPALEFAVSAAGIGIWEIDLHSGDEWWSDITLAIYGLLPGTAAPTRAEWRARFLHPDDVPRVAARAAEFEATHRPYEMDYRIRHVDGSLRWLHSRAAFAFGDTRRVLGMTLDISDRKFAEERAAQAVLVLDLSASQVGFGFGYRDVGREDGYWSGQLKRMFGLAADGPTPDREWFLSMVDEADRALVRNSLDRQPELGEVRETEYSIWRADNGQRRRFISRAVVLDDSYRGIRRFHFAIIDLTELRARDHQVAELLERLKLTTEASGIGTWERDLHTGLGVWDSTMLALYGLSDDASAPSHEQYIAMVHPEDREPLLLHWQQQLELGSSIDYQCRLVLPDGRVRWLQTRGRHQRDTTGREVRRTGICFDITERREAEAALRAKELAERANAAKTEFLSRMSHELRTPLNAVLGFAQLMALDSQEPLGTRQRERLDHVHNAGWHLLALINDVLDLARIESRQTALNMGWVALAPLVEETLAMTEMPAAQRRVELQFVPQTGAPEMVWADRTRLQQLLLNLVSNAVKYNIDGGRVDISVGQGAHDRVVISVRDTGMGMSPQQLQQLFEPFNRLGRESTTIEGTGIGLTVSKLIAEQMGGRLEVHSSVGLGSEFRIVLPHPRQRMEPVLQP